MGCEKVDKPVNSGFIDTFDLIWGECNTSLEGSTICFKSITTDSRCAEGAECKWEGNATIMLNLSIPGNGKHTLELNTNHNYPMDTTINDFNVVLLDLSPYPEINTTIFPEEYVAKLSIVNLTTIESNAQVLSFNPNKDICSWGWTIKIDSDTIKSDDELIGKAVGYEINEPVNVFIQLGQKKDHCSDLTGYDFYEIKKIIKLD